MILKEKEETTSETQQRPICVKYIDISSSISRLFSIDNRKQIYPAYYI
jgi:hypothetical protein